MNLAFGETSGDAKTTNVKHLLLGSVQNVPQSHSDNIFMGFIYGIAEAPGRRGAQSFDFYPGHFAISGAQGKFRYKISMRVWRPEASAGAGRTGKKMKEVIGKLWRAGVQLLTCRTQCP